MPRTIPSERLLATAATAATLVMWASAFVGIRALAPSLAAGPLAFGRLAIAAAALGVVAAVRRPALPARRDTLRLAVCGAAWPGAYFVLLNASERHVDAATASILVKLAPVLVALAAGAMLHEGFPARMLGGCAIALAGVVVVGAGGRGDLIGAALGVGAAVAYASGVVLQKPVVGRVSPLAASTIGTAAGALVCLPFAPALAGRLPELDGGAVAWLLYLGLFPTAIAFTTWAYALARTPAGRLAATTYLVPPLTAAFAWWLLGEAPTGRALVGGVISLLGVVVACTTWRLRRRTAAPEAAARRAA
jgi:drug/metabolite transporter (DMT)-like permease